MTVHSPLTGLSNCSLIREISTEEIARRWLKELNIEWIPASGTAAVQYWEDLDTGFKFYLPNNAAGDDTLYKSLQRLPWYYMENKWEFGKCIEVIRSLSVKGRLLEVGCGTGNFLGSARTSGISAEGTELNPDAAEIARGKGFVVHNSALNALKDEGFSDWDVVCAFQVIEHITEPKSFIEDCLDILKPGGLFFLSVPNGAIGDVLDPQRNDLMDQPPHHMSHWNARVFSSLSTFFPINLLRLDKEPLASYHIDWYAGLALQRASLGFGVDNSPAIKSVLAKILRKAIKTFRPLIPGHTVLATFQKK